jgi:hypothetical protein
MGILNKHFNNFEWSKTRFKFILYLSDIKYYRRCSQSFWEAAGLERGPLSLVRTSEELLEGKVAAPV